MAKFADTFSYSPFERRRPRDVTIATADKLQESTRGDGAKPGPVVDAFVDEPNLGS